MRRLQSLAIVKLSLEVWPCSKSTFICPFVEVVRCPSWASERYLLSIVFGRYNTKKSLEDCPLALQNLPLLPRTIAYRLERPQDMLAGRAVFRKSCLYNSNTLVRWRWFLWSFVLADAHCYRHEERWHLAVALTIVDRGVYVQDGLQLRFKFAFHRCRTSSYFTYLSLKAVVDGADVSAFGAIVRLDIS